MPKFLKESNRHKDTCYCSDSSERPSANSCVKYQNNNNKNNNNNKLVNFAIPSDHRVKLKEREKKDEYLNLARNLKKLLNMKMKILPIVISALGTVTKDWQKNRGLGNKRTRGDNPNYSLVEIGQNTEKSTGDLRRLAVTQTPMKDHQITLMWKTWKGVK